MHTRKTTYLLTTLLLTFNSAWAACELGVPGEGGCEQRATQPNGNKENITADEWWGGLKSSVKQMGNDIATVAKDPVRSFKGDNNKENQGNSVNNEKGGASVQNTQPAAARTSGSKQGNKQGKPKQQTARQNQP